MIMDKARGKVIHEAQPFGFVRNHNMHGGDRGAAWVHNVPRGINEVHNNGVSVSISDADKAPNAFAHASRDRNNPFAPTGMPEKRSHNSYDPRMHISEAPI